MAGRIPALGFGSNKRTLNRVPSPALALAVPFLSVMFASLTPTWPLISSAPILPPFGLLLLIAWRQVRPGVVPIWAGLPLGLFDDLVSGQPFGCAMTLWSVTMVALELIDMRIPWRIYLVDWSVTAGVLAVYLVLCLMFAGGAKAGVSLLIIGPQFLISVLVYPLVGRIVAWLDRLRLTPVVELG